VLCAHEDGKARPLKKFYKALQVGCIVSSRDQFNAGDIPL
jgi:hypothetical protein